MTPNRNLGRRARHVLLCIGALAALAACGGGTSQFTPFAPARLFAFGDETSVLTPEGRNYAVNGVNLDGSIDCKGNPIWVQAVAALYNFAFVECNPTGQAATQARMFAVVGAMVFSWQPNEHGTLFCGDATSEKSAGSPLLRLRSF